MEAAALLINGVPSERAADLERGEKAVGHVARMLMGAHGAWSVRRLSWSGPTPHHPSRLGLRVAIGGLAHASGVALIAGTVALVDGPRGPAIVAADDPREFPEDSTVPVSELATWLAQVPARALVVALEVLSGDVAGLAPLVSGLRDGLVVLEEASRPGDGGLLGALALAGIAAVGPAEGCVTLGGLTTFLRKQRPRASVELVGSGDGVALVPGSGLALMATDALPATMGDAEALWLTDLGSTGLPEVVLPGGIRLLGRLSEGAFGIVHSAMQETIGRKVAVKILKTAGPTGLNRRLFFREIESLGRVDHPNVVRIHHADIGPEGLPFYAMEHLDGRTLRAVLASSGPLPAERALDLGAQLLRGLTAAHHEGVLHGDIKPENMLVVGDGDRSERLVLIDFGLVRIHRRAAEPVVGTPAYMSPEQAARGRVGERSDVFSAALVLIEMLTGWQRKGRAPALPPIEALTFPDPEIARVLERATRSDPSQRHASAAELLAALTDEPLAQALATRHRPPYCFLSAFTENDRWRFHGRAKEIAWLLQLALFQRLVVLTSLSGCGKSSLLRAGLVPRLEELGCEVVYVRCREDPTPLVRDRLGLGDGELSSEVHAFAQQGGRRVVLIFDQLEVLFLEETVPAAQRARIFEALERVLRGTAEAVTVVLAIREDYLARLTALRQRVGGFGTIMRLGPLGPAAARDAIRIPLEDEGITIAPDLLERMATDLVAAADRLAGDLGWGTEVGVYPPHLQIACTVLHEQLADGEATLTLRHYEAVGGLTAILANHLERVLDTELDAEGVAAARELFVGLVSPAMTAMARSEEELMAPLRAQHGDRAARAVLATLAEQRLLVPVRLAGGARGWELAHDSLAPRVMAWTDRKGLERRRLAEILRFHLRQSQKDAPRLLGARETRDVLAHPEVVAEVDRESELSSVTGWSAGDIVRASRRRVLRRRWAIGITLALVAGVGLFLSWRQARETAEKVGNIGRYPLQVTVLDIDAAGQQRPVPPAQLSGLRVEIREVAEPYALAAAESGPQHQVENAGTSGGAHRFQVTAPGGIWTLVVSGRGRAGGATCPPSVIRGVKLPGYPGQTAAIAVAVPSCAMSALGEVAVPAGRVEIGHPDTAHGDDFGPREVEVSAFRVDRTEVSNAAWNRFANGVGPVATTPYEVHEPEHLNAHPHNGAPGHPVGNTSWFEARDYCQWMGKRLPTFVEGIKAARGGFCLDGDAVCARPNPNPTRRYPWGDEPPDPSRAQWFDPAGDTGAGKSTAPVYSLEAGASPYGVLHLAGNVSEWRADGVFTPEHPLAPDRDPVGPSGGRVRQVQNSYWRARYEDSLWVGISYAVSAGNQRLYLGFRCASPGLSP